VRSAQRQRAAIAKHRNMVGSTTGWVYWH